MKRRCRRIVSLALALTLGWGAEPEPLRTKAGTMTGAATEWTQITNFVTLCMSLVQQIQAVVQLGKQVKSWGTTLANITDPQDVLNVARGITSIVGRTRSLAFAGKSLLARKRGLTQQWQKTHPGAGDDPASFDDGDFTSGAAGEQDGRYSREARQLEAVDQEVNEAVLLMLDRLDVHAEEADDEQAIIDKLADKMQTVEGQRQVGMMTNELLFKILQAQFKMLETLDSLALVFGEHASAESQERQYMRKWKQQRSRYTGRFRGDQSLEGL